MWSFSFVFRGHVLALALLVAPVLLAGVVRETRFARAKCPEPVANGELALPLFEGTFATVRLGAASTSSTGIVSCGGRTVGSPMENVSVTFAKDGWVLRMTDPATRNILSFVASGEMVVVRERTPVRGGRYGHFEKPHPALAVPTGDKSAAVTTRAATSNPLVDGAAFLRRGETNTNVIDILVGVDASAAAWIRENSDFAGEENAVDLFAADCIRRCNNTYANTGLDEFFTFNLAGVIEVELDASKLRDANGYVNSSKILDEMTDKKGTYAATWKQIAAKRDAVGADIVSFLVACGAEELEGVIGLGCVLDNDWIRDASFSDIAYNVCLVEAVATGTTMAHEIGHNMGAGHAEMANKNNSGPQLYGYSTGYYFNVTNADGNVFMHAATVMAYNSDGYDGNYDWAERWGEAPDYADDPVNWEQGLFTETEFFSSARHTFRYYDAETEAWIDSGIPLGDERHDNTRILSQTFPLAANFRVRPPVFDQANAEFDVLGGMAIEPIVLTVNTGMVSTAAFTVTGLPAGLKYTAVGQTIAGTPTKLGTFPVKVVIKTGATAATYAMTIRVGGVKVQATSTDVSMGTVTGGGEFLGGKKTTLAAKAVKGYVFAGWYADEAGEFPAVLDVDYRTASVPYVVSGKDCSFWARFVPVAEDTTLQILTEASYTAGSDGSFRLEIPIESVSLPKLSAKGLPAGLKLDAKANVISGTATKPGVYAVTLSATSVSIKKAVTQALTLTVPNFESPYLPNLNPAVDAYPISAGVAFDAAVLGLDLSTTEGYVLSGVKGLPTGLKFNAKTGEITGVATKAGTYTVTITAKNGKLTTTATVTMTVAALPAWAFGTFDGAVVAAANDVEGLGTLTVAANGKISGKIQQDGLSWTLAAASFACAETDPESGAVSFAADVVAKSGKQVATNRLVLAENSVKIPEDVSRGCAEMPFGTNEAVCVTCQNLWKVEPFKTMAKPFDRKTLEVVPGVTLKFAKTGVVTAAGKFVTGQDARGKDVVYSATCSTVLIPQGEDAYSVSLYFAPNAKKNFPGFAQEFSLVWDGTQFVE